MLVARIVKANLSYGALVRLSAAALTPVVLIKAFLEPLQYQFRIPNLVSIGITLLFLILACVFNAPENNTTEQK
jgi:Flp pilus assembly protein protease CpaA